MTNSKNLAVCLNVILDANFWMPFPVASHTLSYPYFGNLTPSPEAQTFVENQL